MERDRFWQLVEQARSASEDATDVDEIADTLTDLLCRLDEDDVVAFARTLHGLAAPFGPDGRDLAGSLVARGRSTFEEYLAQRRDGTPGAEPDDDADADDVDDDVDADDVDGEAIFEAPYDAYGRIVGDDEGYAEAVFR